MGVNRMTHHGRAPVRYEKPKVGSGMFTPVPGMSFAKLVVSESVRPCVWLESLGVRYGRLLRLCFWPVANLSNRITIISNRIVSFFIVTSGRAA